MSLSNSKCEPCEGIGKPLSRDDAEQLLNEVNDWQITDDGLSITRELVCKNFVDAVELINKIKDIAESEDHHPDLHLTGYKQLRIDLSTHAIGGLSKNDFIVAAKIDELIT